MIRINWSDDHSPISSPIKFSDGQPHINLNQSVDMLGNPLDLLFSLCSAEDLVKLALLVDVLQYKRIPYNFRIGYMWGRMDRRLSDNEPYTLRAICKIINSLGAGAVSVFVPHSQATCDLLANYDDRFFTFLENDFYNLSMRDAVGFGDDSDVSVVWPDAGAEKRYSKHNIGTDWTGHYVVMAKHRDERTGQILGIKILEGAPRERCVIVDDLCDGGRTFVEAAKTLRAAGAKEVHLIVAHGIFSKGPALEGIDKICVTNSFPNTISTYELI